MIDKVDVERNINFSDNDLSKTILMQKLSAELDSILLELVRKGKIAFSNKGKIVYLVNSFQAKYTKEAKKKNGC